MSKEIPEGNKLAEMIILEIAL